MFVSGVEESLPLVGTGVLNAVLRMHEKRYSGKSLRALIVMFNMEIVIRERNGVRD